MKKHNFGIRILTIMVILLFLTVLSYAQNGNISSDQWAVTDALGRKVRDYSAAGHKKKDKFIAMFYWTWHQGDDDTTYQVKNITEIVRKYPGAMKDYHHPAWGSK